MMGKWMEVLRERPPDTLEHSGRLPLILAEIAPNPLMEAGCHLGSYRSHFPMLDLVRRDSPAYVDEWLWLDRDSMDQLLAELRRIRRICRREEFLTGLDGPRYHELWRGNDLPETFEAWSDKLEAALGVEGGRWALFSL
jgi:hypothetical protein